MLSHERVLERVLGGLQDDARVDGHRRWPHVQGAGQPGIPPNKVKDMLAKCFVFLEGSRQSGRGTAKLNVLVVFGNFWQRSTMEECVGTRASSKSDLNVFAT